MQMETERLLERIAQKYGREITTEIERYERCDRAIKYYFNTHKENEMDYDALADLYFQRNRTECAKMIVSIARGDEERR
jgi:hypothetical protein